MWVFFSFTLWRNWELGFCCFHHHHQDLVSTDLVYHHKPSYHHHCCYSSTVRFFHKGTRDLVEGFQWITSDDKILLSCAALKTVTRTLSLCLSLSTTSPPCLSLQHNSICKLTKPHHNTTQNHSKKLSNKLALFFTHHPAKIRSPIT